MFKNMKINTKILCVVLAITLGTLLFISILSYTQMLNITTYSQNVNANLGLSSSDRSKQALLKQAEEYLLKLNNAQAESTDKTLQKISGEVTELADYLDDLYRHPDNFVGRELPLPNETENGVASAKYMLAPGVKMTDALKKELLLVSNAEYAFAPVLNNDGMLDNVYLGTKTGISYRFSRSNLYNPDYDPRARGWYTAASAAPGKPVWLDTYLDSYGSVCITCAEAFTDENGEIAGVVAMDITLQKVFEKITNVRIGETGYAFLLDNNMEYIAHPRYGTEGFDTLPMNTATGEQLTAFEEIARSDSGLVVMPLDGIESYVTYATLGETGWKMCISIDIDEIISPANRAKAEIDLITDDAQANIQKTLSEIILNYIVLFASIGILVIILAFIVSGSITRPLMQLAKTARRFGDGELDVKAEVRGRDEVGELAQSFNTMTDNLNNYIDRLTLVTADKERIATELNVATNIQKSMLPSIFPPFPEHREFDMFASMQAAKEVGGDFYDFYLVDESHLALVIADVSGKGVPAALFMVIAKTLIKNSAQGGLSPKAVLEKVNNQLCQNNDAEMFVTVWLGILDLNTGLMTCSNAGHEYPVLRRAGGEYELIKDKHGFVLAGMEDSRYKEYELSLKPGDKLFLYTDGVAEATDANNELFGTDRMLTSLNAAAELSPKETLNAMRRDIDQFVGDAPQFDDITMISFELSAVPAGLAVAPTEQSTQAVLDYVENALTEGGAPMKLIAKMNIAVDEIFSNIARYSGAQRATVDCTVENGEATLVFRDDGTPYNPLERDDPDVTLDADDREVGGLGIFMVKKLLDVTQYEYADGHNVLTLKKKFE